MKDTRNYRCSLLFEAQSSKRTSQGMTLTTANGINKGDLIGEVIYSGGGYSLIVIVQVCVKAKNTGP